MTFMEKVIASLEKNKLNYKHIFYCHKKNQHYLVKGAFTLMPEEIDYVDCYDGKLFGIHIKVSRTSSWEGMGIL